MGTSILFCTECKLTLATSRLAKLRYCGEISETNCCSSINMESHHNLKKHCSLFSRAGYVRIYPKISVSIVNEAYTKVSLIFQKHCNHDDCGRSECGKPDCVSDPVPVH